MNEITNPIRLAIARNNAKELQAAIAAAPPAWHEEVVGGYTVWTRILVDKKRTHLLPLALAAGVDPSRPVIFEGQIRSPLALCVKHGRHQAALQLIEAGARINVWLRKPEVSVLGAVLQQWNRAHANKPRDQTVSPSLESLVARVLTPVPTVLPGVLDAELMGPLARLPLPEGERRKLLMETVTSVWNSGVRPDAGPSAREMRAVITPLRVAMKDNSPCVHDWLRDVLASTPPTALWAESFLIGIRGGESIHYMRQVLEIVSQDWSMQGRPWIPHEVNVWEARWGLLSSHSSLIIPQLQVRLDLLRWGLANGLPISSLLEGPRPMLSVMLSAKSLAAVANPEFFMEVFDLAFRHGLSLSTSVTQAQGKSWGEVIAQECATAGPGSGNQAFASNFWKNHRMQVEEIQARVCAEDIDQKTARAGDDSPATRPRF